MCRLAIKKDVVYNVKRAHRFVAPELWEHEDFAHHKLHKDRDVLGAFLELEFLFSPTHARPHADEAANLKYDGAG